MTGTEKRPMSISMAAAAVPRPVAWALALGSDAALFAANLDLGTIATSITLVGSASIGLYVMGMGAMTKAKIDAKKQWDEANRDSLSAQLLRLQEELKEATAKAQRDGEETQRSLKSARDSLHALRNEANAERLRLRDEIERLTGELHATREDLRKSREQYTELVDLMHRMERQSRDAAAAGERTRADVRENQERIVRLEEQARPREGSDGA